MTKGKISRLISIGIIVMANMGCSMQSKQYNGPIVSGGLGLSLAEWDQLYGRHTWKDDVQAAYENEKWRFMVTYYGDNVKSFKARPSDEEPFSIEVARAESKKFMPSDSKFVETYIGTGGKTVELYSSDSL